MASDNPAQSFDLLCGSPLKINVQLTLIRIGEWLLDPVQHVPLKRFLFQLSDEINNNGSVLGTHACPLRCGRRAWEGASRWSVRRPSHRSPGLSPHHAGGAGGTIPYDN